MARPEARWLGDASGATRFFCDRLEKTFTSRCGDENDMHGWVPILIMIGLGAGFGAFNIVALASHRSEQADPREAGAVRMRHAAGRRCPRASSGQVLSGGDDFPALRHRGRVPLSVRHGAAVLGWTGFVQILVFFAILLTGYVYVWRKGVLDWGHERA